MTERVSRSAPTRNTFPRRAVRGVAAALVAATLASGLAGCFPVVAAGVGAGALIVADRRTSGTYTEDQGISLKAGQRIGHIMGENSHINSTSYNRKVLLTGETDSEELRAKMEETVRGIPNVAGVYNEIKIAPPTPFTSRSADTFITSKVKGRFVDANKFSANHVKVVTEAGVVYLLGLVTQREADDAVQIARTTGDVRKVVNLMEIISDAQAKEIDAKPATDANNDATSR
ncbi:BON domain-containing protein [Oryzomicrobium sp.]|uniref:BON domain-containing protein n=1 Tax=Oryzomicrobium sp. TaxID=1911578 RepID=UPI0025D25C39|nr:BON domain-containing protein [Oryzomicrobium sp.]MCE1241596.1 BON domain-containing protein [Oryzomicrobium sp.]